LKELDAQYLMTACTAFTVVAFKTASGRQSSFALEGMPCELKTWPKTASMNPCSSQANTDRPGVLAARFLKDAMIRLHVALLSSVYHERAFATELSTFANMTGKSCKSWSVLHLPQCVTQECLVATNPRGDAFTNLKK
jgi:hypothetical protein